MEELEEASSKTAMQFFLVYLSSLDGRTSSQLSENSMRIGNIKRHFLCLWAFVGIWDVTLQNVLGVSGVTLRDFLVCDLFYSDSSSPIVLCPQNFVL